MAYDDVPNSDPRGPICPACKRPILKEETKVLIHSRTGATYWHSECSRPIWDTITPALVRLGWLRIENP